MKKLAFILILSFASSALLGQYYYAPIESKAVRLEVNSIGTRSIQGRKLGYSVNVNFNQRWHISYFSLRSFTSGEVTQDEYKGGEVVYFFNPKSRFSVGSAVKVGYYNKYFLNILPSIQTRYQFSELIHLGGGVAYSDGFPFFDLKMGIKLFEK